MFKVFVGKDTKKIFKQKKYDFPFFLMIESLFSKIQLFSVISHV